MAFRWYIYILIYYKRTNRVSNRILSQAGSGNSVLFPQSTASLVCFWHRWVTCFHHVTTKHSALIVGEIIQEKPASAFTAEGFCQHTWDISGVWIDGSMDGLWSLNVIEGAAPTVFFLLRLDRVIKSRKQHDLCDLLLAGLMTERLLNAFHCFVPQPHLSHVQNCR